MNGYFKPLQRKLGVMSLVAACLLAVAWVRSCIVYDWFDAQFWWLISTQGTIACQAYSEFEWASLTWSTGEAGHYILDDPLDDIPYTFPPYDDEVTKAAIPVVVWRTQLCGLDIGKAFRKNAPELPMGWLRLPYWMIVIPPTLLSAYLLLSKPSPRPTGPEPDHA